MRTLYSLSRAITIILLLQAVHLSAYTQEPLPYWKDLQVIAVNKEQPRTTFMSYENKKDAASRRYENSPYYYLLNGTWKFYFVDGYKQLPSNITDPTISTDNWGDIQVPGNWELQGHGVAIYTNHGYEFKPRNPQPPLLPEENPVGVYRRDIDIPSAWLERDIYLHIAGAKSGVYVYLNGQEVGYSEDSKDPAEFHINPYIQAGKNTLTLKIFRWSTGSYLECQDFMRMSGIERDIFIWSQPKTAIQDFRIISTLDDSYQNGIFQLAIDLKNNRKETSAVALKYELFDNKNQLVATASQPIKLEANGRETITFKKDFEQVLTWTSESPNLYRLLMSVEKDGQLTEVIPFNVGFRHIEIKESDHVVNGVRQQLFYVNGQPIKLKGTNIHETTENGHYVTEEQMRRNFELMRQHNINSVRLSHYPQDRRFYELCDEYGLYVYDEANIESHGMYYNLRKGGTLGNNPDWLESHMSRIRNMYERNKNYPSLTIWSLGNEAGNGYNFYEAYLWLKKQDESLMKRPVCYERALWEWNTDMYVPQYPSAAWLESTGASGADRPVVPSEYSHAMGNSNGNIYDQWQAIYKYPQLQGGYIWEWIDHAVLTTNAEGKKFWAYGGDFGKDAPSDGNFVADGVLNPDQSPHPAMAEVKYVHQNVAFEAIDLTKGTFKITNRFYFTDLAKYKITYRILENGKTVKQATLPLKVAPQESSTVEIPLYPHKTQPGVERYINFEVFTKEPEPLVPANFLIAHDQFKLPHSTPKNFFTGGKGPKLQYAEDASILSVHSSKLSFRFDKSSGMITSYQVDGKEYFKDGFGIQPNFWRGPTDNDYGNGAPKRLQVWKEASRGFIVDQTDVQIDNHQALVTISYKLSAGNYYLVRYKIYPSGIIHAAVTFTPTGAEQTAINISEATATATFSPTTEADEVEKEPLEVPRIGVRFRLPVEMNQVQYLGRGPEENYVDRNKGTLVGLYKTSAEELYYPYVRPQENGHHTDTHWVALQTTGGNGLLILADSIIGFNALRNSVEDFDCEEADAPYQWANFTPEEIANRDPEKAKNVMRKQTHEADIVPRNFVEVCIDMRQYGVAGYNSWGAKPLPEYNLYANQTYQWGFTLIPISNSRAIQTATTFAY